MAEDVVVAADAAAHLLSRQAWIPTRKVCRPRQELLLQVQPQEPALQAPAAVKVAVELAAVADAEPEVELLKAPNNPVSL